MEALDFIALFSKTIAEQGLAGMVIVVLLVFIAILWKALQAKNKRIAVLVDRMLKMSEHVNIMIERITGK